MKSAWLWLLTALLASCGGSIQTSSPVEGGNPTLMARLTDTSGRALSGALVRIWTPPAFGHPANAFVLLDSTRSDSSGSIHLSRPSGDGWILEAQSQGLAISRTARQISDPSARLQLEPIARWSSVWQGAGALPQWIGLATLPRRANLDAQGRFTLDSLPAGNHVLLEGPRQDGSAGAVGGILGNLVVSGGQGLGSDTIHAQTGSLLLDDFEGSSLETLLHPWFPASHWYALAPQGDTDRMKPSGHLAASLSSSRFTEGPLRGKAWQFWISPRPGDSAQRGTIGVTLGDDAVNATSVDSLSFWVKGKGTLRIRLIGTDGTLQGDVIMDTGWTRQCLRPSGLAPTHPSTAPSQFLTRLERIEFVYMDAVDVTLSIDDIRLFGWP